MWHLLHNSADFVLFVKKGREEFRVAVETMGMSDNSYFARKKRTHPLMFNLYGRLVQHDVFAEIELFIKDLNTVVLAGFQPRYETLE